MSNIHTILITHLHGDHIYGLPGLCCTLNEARLEPLHIYGPIGIKKYCEIFLKGIHHYHLIIHEINGVYNKINTIVSNSFAYNIEACFIKHSVECYAYSIEETKIIPKINMEKLKPIITKYKDNIINMGISPPNKIIKHLLQDKNVSIITDSCEQINLSLDEFTLPNKDFKIVIALDNYSCNNIFKYFSSANVLIHESTFALFPESSETEIEQTTKTAISRGHSTNIMAAENAQKLGCQHLVLTHFSNRYEIDESGKMIDENKIIRACHNAGFSGNVLPAYDFSVFKF